MNLKSRFEYKSFEGKIFFKIVFVALFLGLLNFGCSKPEPSEPKEQEPEPQPQPELITAKIKFYGNEMHGEEEVSGQNVNVELYQQGKAAEGTFNDGLLELTLTKNLIPNSEGKYDFGEYTLIITDLKPTDEGYMDMLSPNFQVMVDKENLTLTRYIKLVNEEDINLYSFRYGWLQERPDLWRYEGDDEVDVHINRKDLDETLNTFSENFMNEFYKFYIEDNMLELITCGKIKGVKEYNDDSNVMPGNSGILNMIKNFYRSSYSSAGSIPRPSSSKEPVVGSDCGFNPEGFPTSYIYRYILHAAADGLIRGDQDDFSGWPEKCKLTWGLPNGSIFYNNDYEGIPWSFMTGSNSPEWWEKIEDPGLPGWVVIVNGTEIGLNPGIVEANPYKLQAYVKAHTNQINSRFGKILNTPQYKKIKPEEAGQRGNEGTGIERLRR